MAPHLVARRDLVRSLPGPGWSYGHGRSPFHRHAFANDATWVIYNRRMMPGLTSGSATPAMFPHQINKTYAEHLVGDDLFALFLDQD